jgi:hypothetical protein
MKPGEKNIQYNKTNNTAVRVVEQIVTPRNSLSTEAKVDNEFLGVTICSTTLSAMYYLYTVLLYFCLYLVVIIFCL